MLRIQCIYSVAVALFFLAFHVVAPDIEKSVAALKAHPLFIFSARTHTFQYFSFSMVVARGSLIFYPSLYSHEYYSDPFLACLGKACMPISKQSLAYTPEAVCGIGQKNRRNNLQNFVCSHRNDILVNGNESIGVVRFDPILLGRGEVFPLGKNVWELRLYNNDRKELLLGITNLEFFIHETLPYSNVMRFSFVAEKGESVLNLAYAYCQSLQDHGIRDECFRKMSEHILYDLYCFPASDACDNSKKRVRMDMTSIYTLPLDTFVPYEVVVNKRKYEWQIDTSFRGGMCLSVSHFCSTNDFDSCQCANVTNDFVLSLKPQLREMLLDNKYYSRVDIDRLYKRYGIETLKQPISFSSDKLNIVHLVASDLSMKVQVRANIVSSGNWGYGRDIIFFNERDLFKTLLALLESGHAHFRPCMEWILITADETYVNVRRLAAVLEPLDSRRPLYMGNPMQFSSSARECRYATDESSVYGVDFASLSGGIVLSRGILELLQAKIIPAVRTIAMGYDVTQSYCYDFNMNDNRLGGCIYQSLGIGLIKNTQFGGNQASAPRCTSTGGSSVDDDGLLDWVTLPYASPGRNCRQVRDPNRTQALLSSMIVGVSTYVKDRHHAIELTQSLIGSSTYHQTPGVQYVYNASQISVFDDDNADSKDYPDGVRLKTTPPCQSRISGGFHCLQEKISAIIFSMAYDAVIDERIHYAVYTDCDMALNLLNIAEALEHRVDSDKVLMIGDVRWGHSHYPFVSGGGFIFTRKWLEEFYEYALGVYELHGTLPLMGKVHERVSLNGIHGADSYFTYLTYRLGGNAMHLPGTSGFSSVCVFPENYWHFPVLSVHGIVSKRKKDDRYNTFRGPKYFDEVNKIFENQEESIQGLRTLRATPRQVHQTTIHGNCQAPIASSLKIVETAPAFRFVAKTQYAQYFTYSSIIVIGTVFFQHHTPPFCGNSFDQCSYFYACVNTVCSKTTPLSAFKMQKNVCLVEQTGKRSNLQDFFCENYEDILSKSESGGHVLRLTPFRIGDGSLYDIGKNALTIKLFSNDKREFLIGEAKVEFFVEAPRSYIKNLEHRIIAERGESIKQLTFSYCHSAENSERISECIEKVSNDMLYDFKCYPPSSSCNDTASPILMDLNSVYGFASVDYIRKNISIDGKSYKADFQTTFRKGMCSSASHFCVQNNFSSNICTFIANDFVLSLKPQLREMLLDNKYYSRVDIDRLYKRYGIETLKQPISFSSDKLNIVHLVASDLSMKVQVRANIVSSGNWGYGRDIIFFNERDLFKTLLALLESGHAHFRPCMEWILITADETYVNVRRLAAVLEPLDSRRPLYMGNPMQFSSSARECRYATDESSVYGVDFASLSGGIVLSRGILELLQAKIIPAVRTIAMGYDVTQSYCYDFNMNDNRLGGCIYQSLGIGLIKNTQFGGNQASAPRCTSTGGSSVDDDGLLDWVTLPYASPGRNCRQVRDPNRTQALLSSMIVGVSTYVKDRHHAIELTQSLIGSSTYHQTPGVQYVYNASQISVFDDDNADSKDYPDGVRLKTTPPCQSRISGGFHCLQEKISAIIFSMAYDAVIDERIHYAVYTDCDMALNLLNIAEALEHRVDSDKVLMIGDVRWGHSHYPFVSGGGFIFTRKWLEEFYEYALGVYELHGTLPLMGKVHERVSLNGIHGADSYFTYLTYRLGGDVIDMRICGLPL